MLSGSTSVKAVHKMLVNLTPVIENVREIIFDGRFSKRPSNKTELLDRSIVALKSSRLFASFNYTFPNSKVGYKTSLKFLLFYNINKNCINNSRQSMGLAGNLNYESLDKGLLRKNFTSAGSKLQEPLL